LLGLGPACHADGYPEKPIRWILPYAPGGGAGLIARPIAEKLSTMLGRPVVVDERGGANGTVGMTVAAQAPADGYTIIMALTAQTAINPILSSKLPYDSARDYAPVTVLGSVPYMVAVNPGTPVRSVKELVAFAKSKPAPLTYGTSGTGSIPHLALELLGNMTGIVLSHVPYRGGGPAMIAAISGEVPVVGVTVTAGLQHVRAGRLRAIGVTSSGRSRNAPEVPAISETLPGYEAISLYYILAPAGTPSRAVARLNDAFNKALAAPKVRKGLLDNDFEPRGGAPGEVVARMRDERTKWTKVVAATGIRLD
jgi:tripartite-type tricarboxylate transporter receptor subunit TctC